MRALLVGCEPEAVDLPDPALPPGLDAARVAAGIAATLEDMRGRGWTAESCLVQPDADAEAEAAPALARRLIAFYTRPEDSADAVARVRGGRA